MIQYAKGKADNLPKYVTHLLKNDVKINEENCKKNVYSSTAMVTALVPKLGYKKAEKIIEIARQENISVKEAAIKSSLISEKEFNELVTSEAVCKLGN